MEGFLLKSFRCTHTAINNQLNRGVVLIHRLYSVDRKSNFSDGNSNDDRTTNENGKKSEQKSIQVAVIGAPNAGKSSFINTITNHRICPTSRKVHTTLSSSANIHLKDRTQMVLYDTPGLTTVLENKKYNLEDKFLREVNQSIGGADLIAVVHDVSNSYTRNVIHPTVLEALITHKTIPSILIMNKIDMVRAKRILLDLVQVLTEGTLQCKQRRYLPWAGREEEFLADMKRPVKYKNAKSAGWPYFSEVFMVSALSGDGIQRVAQYIADQSKEQPWQYPDFQFTDQRAETLILDNVRAVLMDYLPNEIPYKLHCEMELFEIKDNRIHAFVNIVSETDRISRLICGSGNKRIKQISEVVASNIIQLYNLNVEIVLNVVPKKTTAKFTPRQPDTPKNRQPPYKK